MGHNQSINQSINSLIIEMSKRTSTCETNTKQYKKAVLPQGNRAMPQVFFSVEVRQQHSLQV